MIHIHRDLFDRRGGALGRDVADLYPVCEEGQRFLAGERLILDTAGQGSQKPWKNAIDHSLSIEDELGYGIDLLTEKRTALANLERNGLVTLRNDRVRLTREGAVVADAVALKLAE